MTEDRLVDLSRDPVARGRIASIAADVPSSTVVVSANDPRTCDRRSGAFDDHRSLHRTV